MGGVGAEARGRRPPFYIKKTGDCSSLVFCVKGDPRLRGDDILAAYRLINPSVSLDIAS